MSDAKFTILPPNPLFRRLISPIPLIALLATGCQSEPKQPPAGFVVETKSDHPTITEEDYCSIAAHNGCIDSIAFAPNGDEVATCGMDKTVRFWNSRTGVYIRGFQTTSRVMSLAYSRDGKLLAVGTQDDGIHSWNTKAWLPQSTTTVSHDPDSLAFSPDGKFLAVGARPIAMIRVQDWKVVRELSGHEAGSTSVAYSPDGKLLASGNADGLAMLWSVSRLTEMQKYQHDEWVGAVAFTADGSQFVTSSMRHGDGTQTMELLWRNVNDGEVIRVLRGESLRGRSHCDTRFALSLDGKYVVATLRGFDESGIVIDDELQGEIVGSISLWDRVTLELLAISHETKGAYGVAFSPDSERFGVVDVDGNLQLWDVDAFQAKHCQR
jgi:WD40 repeat protein